MSVISINGYGDADLLQKFVKDWNDAEKTSLKRKDIYIDSGGGLISVFYTIQDMINSCPTKCTLTAAGDIQSMAFDLFYHVKCKRTILPYAFGMYHLGNVEISIDEKGKPKEDSGKARFDNIKLMKSDTIQFCKKIGMNAKEIQQIQAGKDVYFQQDRLNHFLKNTL